MDLNPLKLEWARKSGATHTINVEAVGLGKAVRDPTRGRGADVAVEAAGQNVSIRQTLEASRLGARVVIPGKTAFGQEVSFPFNILMGEREIVRTSYSMSRPRIDFPKLAGLYMRGELYLDEVTSMKLPLSEIKRRSGELE